MISTEAVASRQGPADRSGLRSWLNRASLLPVATTEMHAVRPRCRASRGGDPGRGRAAHVSGSRAPTADACPRVTGAWAPSPTMSSSSLKPSLEPYREWFSLQQAERASALSASRDRSALPACAFLRERQRAARALKARPWQGGPWLARRRRCFTRPSTRPPEVCQNRLIRPTSLLIGMILM
jgi:hypothetical protein